MSAGGGEIWLPTKGVGVDCGSVALRLRRSAQAGTCCRNGETRGVSNGWGQQPLRDHVAMQGHSEAARHAVLPALHRRSSFLPSHPDGGGRTLSQPVQSLHEKQEPETPYHTVSTPGDAHTGLVSQSCSESSCSPPLPSTLSSPAQPLPALLGGFQSGLPAPPCHVVASPGKAAICPLPGGPGGVWPGQQGPLWRNGCGA